MRAVGLPAARSIIRDFHSSELFACSSCVSVAPLVNLFLHYLQTTFIPLGYNIWSNLTTESCFDFAINHLLRVLCTSTSTAALCRRIDFQVQHIYIPFRPFVATCGGCCCCCCTEDKKHIGCIFFNSKQKRPVNLFRTSEGKCVFGKQGRADYTISYTKKCRLLGYSRVFEVQRKEILSVGYYDTRHTG